MFDVRGNEIWYSGRLFAVIVATGPASFGWSDEARSILLDDVETVDAEAVKVAMSEIEHDGNTARKFDELPDLPEGFDYPENELRAVKNCAFLVRKEVREHFDLMVQAHIRAERLQMNAELAGLWNRIEEIIS
jgi:hypothetical protein